MPLYLATLATKECAEELALLHESLRAFHSPQEVPLVVGCSSELLELVNDDDDKIKKSSSCFRSLRDERSIRWIPCLDAYGAINRREMERQRGVWYPTRHCDFMMEKANVMDWALQQTDPSVNSQSLPEGVLFVDSDITFLDSLHSMFPDSSEAKEQIIVGASPHFINSTDERLFGRYNGGMLFASHPVVLWHWRRATHASRYFDQASIEDVVREINQSEGGGDLDSPSSSPSLCPAVHLFGPHVNYGFWRMFQSPRKVEDEVRRFSIDSSRGGIVYDGRAPLQSVHTHWFMPTQCREIPVFNRLVRRWVREVRSVAPSMYRGLMRL